MMENFYAQRRCASLTIQTTNKNKIVERSEPKTKTPPMLVAWAINPPKDGPEIFPRSPAAL
jgi:hypothetical protein